MDNLMDNLQQQSAISEPMKQSGLGIASFVSSVLLGGLLIVLVMVAGILETMDPGAFNPESAAAMILGFLLIGTAFLELVPIGLGIAGIVQKQRKKIFAFFGIAISIASIAGLGILFIIGTAMK